MQVSQGNNIRLGNTLRVGYAPAGGVCMCCCITKTGDFA